MRESSRFLADRTSRHCAIFARIDVTCGWKPLNSIVAAPIIATEGGVVSCTTTVRVVCELFCDASVTV